MIFHTSDFSICNGNIKDLIGTPTFYTKSYDQALPTRCCCQNIFTTSWWNLNKIGWPELHNIWSLLDVSLAPFWKKSPKVKQFNDEKMYKQISSFIIPKITVVWHMWPGLKLQLIWQIPHVLLETVRMSYPYTWGYGTICRFLNFHQSFS